MAARGNQAKELVKKKIIEAFGDSYIGEADKKLYVWSEEDGERIQVALSMTCPKTPITIDNNTSVNESTGKPISGNSTPVDISEDDRRKIEELKTKLGITTG